MNETRRLAQFIAETGLPALPAEVVERLRIYTLDNLAAGFAGSSTPWAEMVASLAHETSPDGPCSVFGRPWGCSPSLATLTNGTMVGGFECDHPYVAGSSHPSAAVFPPVMALAERDHLDGARFVAALAAGYEAACRIGRAATRAVEDERGFHGPGTNAPFGGAAGAARVLGLDVEGVTNALGIAGSHGAGLLEFVREGAMTKRLHVGRGGQLGLESALLAARGFTGPSTVLEGPRGFFSVYSPAPRPELLLEDLGARYLLMDVIVKAYPCHISFHAVVDGISRLGDVRKIKPGDLGEVRITGSERMMEERFLIRSPSSVLGAQYSLPFSAAIALCYDASDPRAFGEESLRDPRVRGLAQRIVLEADPGRFGGAGQPAAEVVLHAGELRYEFQVTGWKGSAGDPCSYDDIADKFRRYAEPYVKKPQIDEIVERVARLEQEKDIAPLARLIRAQ